MDSNCPTDLLVTVSRHRVEQAGTVAVDLATPARYVLVSFNELGTDNACTDNPYRGAINELGFA